jgi:hypothetical protein
MKTKFLKGIKKQYLKDEKINFGDRIGQLGGGSKVMGTFFYHCSPDHSGDKGRRWHL